RVLDLLPGAYSDNIRTLMRIVDFPNSESRNSASQYEALSYVSGDLQNRQPVVVNGVPLGATPSLRSALRHVRLSSQKRTIWVNVICINQCDIEKRSVMVSKMDAIYSTASRVI
ncbi:hypothetical protein BAUCODRAFT_48213, partial [Baudoinia panamericana UAMH 10762]